MSQGDTNFIAVIHNIESILGITVQNALNTVDDEATAEDDDEDDNSSGSESDEDDEDDDGELDGVNFVPAPIAESRGAKEWREFHLKSYLNVNVDNVFFFKLYFTLWSKETSSEPNKYKPHDSGVLKFLLRIIISDVIHMTVWIRDTHKEC